MGYTVANDICVPLRTSSLESGSSNVPCAMRRHPRGLWAWISWKMNPKGWHEVHPSFGENHGF